MSAPNRSEELRLALWAFSRQEIGERDLLAALDSWSAADGASSSLSDALSARGALTPERWNALAREQANAPESERSWERLSGELTPEIWRRLDRFPELNLALERLTLAPAPPTRPSGQAQTGPFAAKADPYATRPLTHAGPASASASSSSSQAARDWRLRYQVLREHKAGGLGQVAVALDRDLHREVALKTIHRRLSKESTYRDVFLLEAEITGRLEHPGIVPVYALGQDEAGAPCYAMRFIRGESLHERLKTFHDAASAGGSSPTDAAELTPRAMSEFRELLTRFLSVCDAISYAHNRLVAHRDIKPANIMLGPFGETLVVDWGLAYPLGEVHHDDQPRAKSSGDPKSSNDEGPLEPHFASWRSTPPGSSGTPAYMSPEQALGQVSAASDIYGLGATLYHILVGRPPFQGPPLLALDKASRGEFPPPRQVKPWVCPALEAVCLKAMALAPENRYRSARALRQEIKLWLDGEPVAAYPEPWAKRFNRWANRHKSLLASAAVLLITAIVALTVGLLMINAEKNKTRTQYNRAEANADTANKEREKAEAAAKAEREQRIIADKATREAKNRLSAQFLGQGLSLMDKGDWFAAIPWLAKSQELDQDDPTRSLAHQQRLAVLLRSAPVLKRVWTEPVAPKPTAPTSGPNSNSRVIEFPARLEFAALSSDAERIAILTSGRTSFMKFGTDAAQPRTIPFGGQFAKFSPQGSLLAIVNNDRVELWDQGVPSRIAGTLLDPLIRALDLSFSADGKKLIVCGGRRTSADEGRLLLAPVGGPPRGPGAAKILDAQTGQAIGSLLEHNARFIHAEFDRDGRRVLTAGEDGVARVWSGETGLPLSPVLDHGAPLTWATFSPDGQSIATVGGARTRLWVMKDGRWTPTHVLTHRGEAWKAAFSPEGERLVTVSASDDPNEPADVQAWSARTGRPWYVNPTERPQQIAALGLDRHSEQALVILPPSESPKGDWIVRRWNLRSGDPIGPAIKLDTPKVEPDVRAQFDFACDPNGERIAVLRVVYPSRKPDDPPANSPPTYPSVVWLLDARSGKRIQEMVLPDPQEVLLTGFSPDSRWLMVATTSGDPPRAQVRAWRANNGEAGPQPIVLEFPQPLSRIALRVNGDGRLISAQGYALIEPDPNSAPRPPQPEPPETEPARPRYVWQAKTAKIATGELSGPVIMREDRNVNGSAFAGDAMVIADRDGLQCWSVASGQPIGGSVPEPLARFVISPDHQRLLTVSGSVARIWRIPEATPITKAFTLGSGVTDRLQRIVFSDDGSRLAMINDQGFQIWDALSGDALTPRLSASRSVAGAWFHGDNSSFRILGGSVASPGVRPDRVQMMYTADRTLSYESNFEPDPTILRGGRIQPSLLSGRAQFSEDGRRALIWGTDEARVWDLERVVRLDPPLKHNGLKQVALAADGERAATLGGDGAVRFWRLGQPIARSSPLIGRPELTPRWAIAKSAVPEASTPPTPTRLQWTLDLRGWDLRPDARPSSDWLRYGELIAGRTQSDLGPDRPIEPSRQEQFRSDLANRRGEDFAERPTDWLEAATQAELAANWDAAAKALDQAIAAEPKSWSSRIRRCRARLELSRFDEAKQDFNSAFALSAQETLDWADQDASVREAAAQWRTAGAMLDFIAEATGNRDAEWTKRRERVKRVEP